MPAATAATFVLSVVIALPFAVIWWDAQASVWPYALASTVLETIYVVGLAYAYRTADVSFVYPLTRGLAPVLTLAFVVAAFAHRPSAWCSSAGRAPGASTATATPARSSSC